MAPLWAATSLAAADRMDKVVEPGWRCAAHDRAAPCLDLSTCQRGAARQGDRFRLRRARRPSAAQGFVKHREKLAKRARAAGVGAIFVLPRRDLQAVPFPEANINGMKKQALT